MKLDSTGIYKSVSEKIQKRNKKSLKLLEEAVSSVNGNYTDLINFKSLAGFECPPNKLLASNAEEFAAMGEYMYKHVTNRMKKNPEMKCAVITFRKDEWMTSSTGPELSQIEARKMTNGPLKRIGAEGFRISKIISEPAKSHPDGGYPLGIEVIALVMKADLTEKLETLLGQFSEKFIFGEKIGGGTTVEYLSSPMDLRTVLAKMFDIFFDQSVLSNDEEKPIGEDISPATSRMLDRLQILALAQAKNMIEDIGGGTVVATAIIEATSRVQKAAKGGSSPLAVSRIPRFLCGFMKRTWAADWQLPHLQV